MAVRPLNIISLCTGGGGLDLGVELAIPSARPVCLVEREAFAVAHLVEAMRQGLLAEAPIHGDARTFRGRPWRGLVDGVIGGIPCQPHSIAGKRLGEEDERDLWSTARRIIVQSGAWFVLIENVGGMLSSGGAERVYRDLQRMGFAVEGILVRASEVGAPHERERLFILGVADSDDLRRRAGSGPAGQWTPEQRPPHCGVQLDSAGAAEALSSGRSVADAGRDGRDAERGSAAANDAGCGRSREPQGHQPGPRSGELVAAPSIGRREGRPAPEIRGGRRASTGAGSPLAHADQSVLRGKPSARELQKLQRHDGSGSRDGAPGGPMGDALGGVLNGRTGEPERSAEGRAADHGPGAVGLFPPGPGDIRGWLGTLEQRPDLAPVLRRDVDVADPDGGDSGHRQHGADEDGRVRAHGPERGRVTVSGSGFRRAQSGFRRVADGMANRLDRLRLLGNGVVPLQAAYALRTLATDLSRRSAGAAELVRLMEQDAQP